MNMSYNNKMMTDLEIAAIISGWTKSKYLLPKPPEMILVQMQKGLSVILRDDDDVLVGYATFYFLHQEPLTWELGTVVVDPARRRQGFGKKLYQAIEKKHDELGGILLATTKDARVVRIGRYHGLELMNYADIDLEVRKPLCYEASCFTPKENAEWICAREYHHGGDCYLRRRMPKAK